MVWTEKFADWKFDHQFRMRRRRYLSQTWRMPADQTQALDRWIDGFPQATEPRQDAQRNDRGVPAQARPVDGRGSSEHEQT